MAPRTPIESGAPDNKQYMHPTLLKNYGNWKMHDRPRPGEMRRQRLGQRVRIFRGEAAEQGHGGPGGGIPREHFVPGFEECGGAAKLLRRRVAQFLKERNQPGGGSNKVVVL